MRRSHSVLVSLLAALTLGGVGFGLTQVGPGGPMAVRAQTPPDACTVAIDKTAAPASIVLGAEITVTLKVDGSCPKRDRPADVILVIDRSSSMRTENKLAAARQAAIGFVDRIDPTLVHVGVVAISEQPQRIHALSADQAALRTAISGIAQIQGTNLVDALAMARDDLAGPDARPSVAHVIVFLTDGRHRSGPDISTIYPILDALRAAGVEIYAIALGSDADRDLLRRIASSTAHFFDSPTATELAAIYQQIAGRIEAQSLAKTARIVDRVPANMQYVAGSGVPVEPAVSSDGKTLTWDLVDLKEAGIALTYRLRPQAVGVWPTNVEATIEGTDGFDNAFRLTFPVPNVTVTAPALSECICPILFWPWRVRAADRQLILDAARADPTSYYGWNLKMDENKPGAPPYPETGYDEPPNPRRVCLDLRNQNIAYHPMFNPPVWRAGCLSAAARAGIASQAR